MKTTVKGLILAISAGSLMFASCNSTEEKRAEMKKENVATRDSFNRIFSETLKDINANLEVINEKEGVIMLGPNSPLEKNISEKEKILRNIHLINSLIDDSREKMLALDSKVKEYEGQEKISSKQLEKYRTENKKLEKLMAASEERLKGYEDELSSLKSELSSRDFQLSDLNGKLGASETKCQMLQEYSDMYEKIAYTAYYTEGNYKKLKEEGVVQKENVVGMITGKDKLSENLPRTNFVSIDIRKITSIPVNSKKAKLMTTHPSNSYEWKKSGDKIASIEIKDPEAFWKTSKYLVVETH